MQLKLMSGENALKAFPERFGTCGARGARHAETAFLFDDGRCYLPSAPPRRWRTVGEIMCSTRVRPISRESGLSLGNEP